MVSVVGGLISSTIWRVVGGGDSHSIRRPGGEAKKRHVLSTPRAHFVRRPIITHIHTQDGLLETAGVGGSHFGKGLEINDIGKKNENIGDIKDPDTDWVIFDINDVTTVPYDKSCPKPKVILSSVTTPTTDSLTTETTTTSVSPRENDNTGLVFVDDSFAFPTLTKPIRILSQNENTPENVKDMFHLGTICEESNPGDFEALCPTKSHLKPSACDPSAPGHEVKGVSPTCCTSNTAASSAVIATPGNYLGSEDEEASPRQCVGGVEVSNSDTWCGSGVICHAPAMAATNITEEKDIEALTSGQTSSTEVSTTPEPPPVSLKSSTKGFQDVNTIMETTSGDGVASCSGGEASNSKQVSDSVPSVTYREDIRAYDIYHITPNQSSDAHYSRLPSALPTLTDSDSDPDDARWRQGIRKRKRRISGRKEGEGGKRYREGEETDDEANLVGLDDITVYTSPYLEDYTNRISILHRLSSTVEEDLSSSANARRHVTFSTSTSTAPHHLHHPYHTTSTSSKTPTKPTTKISSTLSHTPCIPPSNTASSKNPSNPPRNSEDDVSSDDDSINNDNDDDDDDDEASTVVPDDFDDETDSDIEVLVHSESWVDLSNQPEVGPDRVTPLPFGNGEETIRLLREAQKESNQSSARVSLASSRRDTPRDSPHDSPKSPPNSPNTELTTDPEEAILKGVYINYYNKEGDFIRVEKNTETDWIWDWSSRPDQSPPKEWRFSHPGKGAKRGASIRRVMVGKSSLFSRDVLYTLLITNVLSLLIGTGIGIWLSKRSSSGAIVTLPIN